MSSNEKAFIEIRDLRKTYCTPAGEFEVLKGIDIEFAAGKFVAVIGKSGSGKSTFINMLSGIDRPTAGTVRIGEHQVHTLNENQMARWRGRHLGIVFQFFQLLPTLTVVENVMLPMQINHIGTVAAQEARARELLEQMGVGKQADKLPAALSGGQQQRVAIARSLINDPQLIIADEPTGNLDTKTAEEIFQVFKSLTRAGKTILMVTHDDDFARRVDRTIIISDGKVVDECLVKALRQLNKELILDIEQTIQPLEYRRGDTIVRQGEQSDKFYIVVNGTLDVLIDKPGGGQMIADRRQAGQYFGAMELLGQTRRSASVVAADDAVRLLEINEPLFDRLMDSSRTFRHELESIVEARKQSLAHMPVNGG